MNLLYSMFNNIKGSKYWCWKKVVHFSMKWLLVINIFTCFSICLDGSSAKAQCIPVSSTGFQENLLQAAFHTVLYKTPTGYAASGDGTNVNGQEQPFIQDIGFANGYTGIPDGIQLKWGTVGGHAQLVFIGNDDIIYAGGNEDRVLDPSLTSSNTYGPTSLTMPAGVGHSDIIKFQASNEVLMMLTSTGDLYTTGNTCSNISTPCINLQWTLNSMPTGVSPLMIDITARTLFMYGSDGNFYTRGTMIHIGDGTAAQDQTNAWQLMTPPPLTPGTAPVQIEIGFVDQSGWGGGGFNEDPGVTYLVLDQDSTIHSIGSAPIVGNNSNESFTWTKVGNGCPDGELTGVVYITATDNDMRNVGAGAILSDGTVQLWGMDSFDMLAGASTQCPSAPCLANGTTMNNILYLENGSHLTPAIGSGGGLCNVGHNEDGGFGDGTEDDRECYECLIVDDLPTLCVNGDCGLDISVSVTICEGQSYFEQSSEYTETGVYTDTYQTAEGCDSTVTTHLTVVTFVSQVNTAHICEGEIYFEQSSEYSQTGIYTDIYQTTYGCDSIVTTELTVHSPASTTNEVTICEGESYFEQSSEYTESGTYIDSYQTSYGCDSLVITNLNVLPNSLEYKTALVCEGEDLPDLEGYFDSVNNRFIDTLQNMLGCDSIIITEFETIASNLMLEETAICEGQFVSVEVESNDGYDILWSDGSQENELSISEEGWHWVQLNSEYCSMIDSIFVAVQEPVDGLFKHGILCEGIPLTLNMEPDNGMISWSNGAENNSIIVDSPGVYMAVTENACGEYTSVFDVISKKCGCDLWVPNAITSDSDGLNDNFRIEHYCDFISYELMIFDRWGHQVFHSFDPDASWIANVNGGEYYAKSDVYNWVITYKYYDQNNSLKNERSRGHVTVIR